MAVLSQGRPRGRARAAVVVGLLLAAAALALPACFNPQQPGCAFSCANDGLCPSGYSCGSDKFCHRDDGQGSCSITTDAASDAAKPADAKPADAKPADATGQ